MQFLPLILTMSGMCTQTFPLLGSSLGFLSTSSTWPRQVQADVGLTRASGGNLTLFSTSNMYRYSAADQDICRAGFQSASGLSPQTLQTTACSQTHGWGGDPAFQCDMNSLCFSTQFVEGLNM